MSSTNPTPTKRTKHNRIDWYNPESLVGSTILYRRLTYPKAKDPQMVIRTTGNYRLNDGVMTYLLRDVVSNRISWNVPLRMLEFTLCETNEVHIPPEFAAVDGKSVTVDQIREIAAKQPQTLWFGPKEARPDTGEVCVHTNSADDVEKIGDVLVNALSAPIEKVTFWDIFDMRQLPKWVGRLAGLRVLYVSGCQSLDRLLVQYPLPAFIPTLCMLTVLDCGGRWVLPAWLGECTNLSRVDTRNRSLDVLRGCRGLEFVYPHPCNTASSRWGDVSHVGRKTAARLADADKTVTRPDVQLMALCGCDLEVMRGPFADYQTLKIVYAFLSGDGSFSSL